jgi:hypothetical protein
MNEGQVNIGLLSGLQSDGYATTQPRLLVSYL